MRRASLAIVPLALLALTPAAHAATRAGGNWHEVAAEGGTLDITGVSLGQDERDLVFRARSSRPITSELLSRAGGGEICLILDPKSAGLRRLCVTRDQNHWRLRLPGRSVEAKVSRPRNTEVEARFRPDAASIPVGPATWTAYARAAGCPETLGLGAGARDPGEVRLAADPELPCAHEAPRTGSYDGRVWDVRVTGCVARGPSQVSRGPKVKRVALTYDDGPAALTPSFVKKLRSLRVPATFFVVGQQVGGRAGLLRQMLREGHMVANHSWNHANLGGGGSGASSQLSRTSAAIRKATGFTPCLFRPPYGSTGSDLVRRTRSQGMTSILWSVDPLDWRRPGAGSIVSRVVSATGRGAIILSHDGGGPRDQTLSALPKIVASLKRKGYSFVTVNELLGYDEKLSLVR